MTNKHNLPQPIINAIQEGEREPVADRYSVTELLNPARAILLKRLHYREIESDAADLVPALLGTAVHHLFESCSDSKAVTEHQVMYKVEQLGILTGRIDLINYQASEIVDYKTCSVNKIIRKDFEDWRMQGLMYAWLIFKAENTIIRKLRFIAICKDWSKMRCETQSNYPQSPVFVWEYQITDSDYDFIEKWVRMRLKVLKENLESNTLPSLCNDEECWYTGTKYAVFKNPDDKRAAIVCDTIEEANGYIENKLNGTGTIQTRYGEYLRCKYYCECSKFCERRTNEREP